MLVVNETPGPKSEQQYSLDVAADSGSCVTLL